MFLNEEKFKLVEVLPDESYREGHIPGAINMPLEKLETLAKGNLKKNDTIVVYCGDYTCEASTKAARKLLEMGYKNILDFKGGKREWIHAGFKLHKVE
jgi:rhodanese-related sulfurtransferase